MPGQSIALVEDDRDLATSLEMALEKSGYEVVITSSWSPAKVSVRPQKSCLPILRASARAISLSLTTRAVDACHLR